MKFRVCRDKQLKNELNKSKKKDVYAGQYGRDVEFSRRAAIEKVSKY